MAGNVIIAVLHASAILLSVAVQGAKMVFDETRKKKREETTKALESKMNEDLQDLNNKIKALHEDFRKLEESTKNEVQITTAELENQGKKEILGAIESMMNENLGQLSQKFQTLKEDVHEWKEASKCEVQLLRDDLEKQQEKKDEERSRALESMLEQKLGQLSQKIQTLEEFVQEWPETTKCEVQLLRDDLEKQGMEEKEIVRALESMLREKLRELSQKIQTLEEDVHEWPETTKREVWLLRDDLEKQGKKEEENLLALRCGMAMLYQQLSQGFQTLGQVLQFRQELPYHEFPLFRGYLEYNQGIATPREEIIHLRVLELARGERINNTWTDSRSAQGALRNRRLREGQGFFRSVSGGEVEWITPGASDNLHANQDQRTACLDSLSGGIQRSMDIRASWTNNHQVLMLTFGVLISIIILILIFTLLWPESPHSHQLLP